MKRPIELVAGMLASVEAPASDRVRGRHGPHAVEVRFVDRGVGSTRDPYTEVFMLGAARRSDLELHVVPQKHDDVLDMREGRGTDVIVGEVSFDDAFFVEAAPEDVVKRLFDATMRERMRTLAPIGVHTHADGLLVEKQGWDTEGDLRAMIELGAALVERVPVAFDEADRAAASRAGYREMVSPEVRDGARRDEVRAVLERKKQREDHRQWQSCLVVIVIFVVIGVIVLFTSLAGLGGSGVTEY